MHTLLTGAMIITMDEERRMFENGAVALVDDRIAYVGPTDELPIEYHSLEPIDTTGKAIFPGFVNIHTHAALSILRGIGDDMGVAPAYSPEVPQGVFLTRDDCYMLSLLGGLEALRFGTTCIVDNYIYADEAAKAFDRLGMRAVVSERLHDADLFKVPRGVYEFDRARGETLLARNLALFERWQGVSNGRTECRIGPHAPDTCSTDYLKLIQQAAADYEAGLVIHLAQSPREVAEIRQRSGLSPTAYLADLGLLTPKMIAGHCIFVDDEDVRILAESGVYVSHQSGSNAKGGMMAPIKAMREQGVPIGLGTDNMAADMIEVMRLALVTARMREKEQLALRAFDVLQMATINGARALGLEDEIGSLVVGKKADLVVVDYRQPHLVPVVDPVANLVHNGLGSDVDRVYVDGRPLVVDGIVQSVDTSVVLEEAQRVTDSAWRRMAGGPPRIWQGTID